MNAQNQPRIVIIGAGSSGICMGIHLKRAGFDDFVMLDKADGLGGTWWYNTYPGAECDVQSHLYQFSFEQKNDWSRPFGPQKEILAYLRHCAEKYGLAPHIRFNTTIDSASWQDEDGCWRVKTESGEIIEPQILISALGMFNKIVFPSIPGVDEFQGHSFH